MEVAAELLELARIEADPAQPVASLYLDTRWSDEQQRRKVRLFVHERCRGAAAALSGRSAIDRSALATLDRVEARASELIEAPDAVAGFALFASSARGLWKEIPSRLPFGPAFAFGPEPLLLPLARLAEARDPILVAVVGHREVVLSETSVGELPSRTELHFQYPGTHRRTEWFHGRRFYAVVGYQRRQNRLDAARAIAAACERSPHARLVLAGPADQVAALRDSLPDRLRARMLPDLRLRHPTPEAETLRLALAALRDEGRADALRRAEAAVDAALAGGRAVLGPWDVVLAVQEGRVHELFLDRARELPGWHCKGCDAIGTHAEAGCPYCGGATETRDLAEEISRRVLLGAGDVHVVDGNVRFARYSGVAAHQRPRGTHAPLGDFAREPTTVSSAG
ncbi:MAG: baeRF10 domain-containing protein [Myxococcales bacterium]